MSYLLDTNILSEIRKHDRCNRLVSAWYASVSDEDLFLSTLVLGEIRKGVELSRVRDPDKAAVLEQWLDRVEAAFGARVLGIDSAVSQRWGRVSGSNLSRRAKEAMSVGWRRKPTVGHGGHAGQRNQIKKAAD